MSVIIYTTLNWWCRCSWPDQCMRCVGAHDLPDQCMRNVSADCLMDASRHAPVPLTGQGMRCAGANAQTDVCDVSTLIADQCCLRPCLHAFHSMAWCYDDLDAVAYAQ